MSSETTSSSTNSGNCTLNRCAHAAASSSVKKMFDRSGKEVPFWVCVISGVAAAGLASYFMWNCYTDDEEDLGTGFGSKHGQQKKEQRLAKEAENNNGNDDEDEDDDDDDFDFSPVKNYETEYSKLEKLAKILREKLSDADSSQDEKLVKIRKEIHAIDEQITFTMIKMDGLSVSSDKDRSRRKKLIQNFSALSGLIQPLYQKK